MKNLSVGRALLLAFPLILGASVQNVGNAAELKIINPSFEQPTLADGGFTYSIPGWQLDTASGSLGVYNPADTAPYFYGAAVPDGNNVAYSNQGSLFQALESTLEANTSYSLQVDIGRRPEPNVDFSGYGVQLWAGDVTSGQLLAEMVSTPGTEPLAGQFTSAVLEYTTADQSLVGKNLGIRLLPNRPGGGVRTSQVNFDNVRLSAITNTLPFDASTAPVSATSSPMSLSVAGSGQVIALAPPAPPAQKLAQAFMVAPRSLKLSASASTPVASNPIASSKTKAKQGQSASVPEPSTLGGVLVVAGLMLQVYRQKRSASGS